MGGKATPAARLRGLLHLTMGAAVVVVRALLVAQAHLLQAVTGGLDQRLAYQALL